MKSLQTHGVHCTAQQADSGSIGTLECPICASRTFTEVFSARPLDYVMCSSFAIARCSQCGHGLTELANQPSSEDLYESGNYDSGEGIARRFLRPLLRALERNKLRYLSRWKSAGSLLEVGAGKGWFLYEASRAGFDVFGIEPSARSRAFAERLIGPRVSPLMLDAFVVSDQARPFDVAVLWHVLEHLEEPGMAIEQLKRVIAPDGLLMVGVPNFCSWQTRFGQQNWYHLDPPRHLHHFCPQGLATLLERNGFELADISHSSFFQNWLGDLVTVLNLVTPGKNALINFLKRNRNFYRSTGQATALLSIAWNIVLLPVVIPCCLVLTVLSQSRGRAGTIVCVARRKE